MSRVGKLPIRIPKNVNIQIINNILHASSDQGKFILKIPKEIHVILTNRIIILKKIEETKKASEKYGLIRSLLNNSINGVSKKFEKILIMKGIGYNAKLIEKNLVLNVGFSHKIKFLIPDDIEISIDENKSITIKGCDKEKVGLFSSTIRAIRPPEPYKGKGICYNEEIVLRKAGKS
jgi:large subunit ribosomal protein L6